MISSGWHFNGDQLPSQGEVDAMAAVLESRHGLWAAEVAEFFATAHTINGDKQRAWAWTGVAETVRRKEEERLSEAH
ncbi:MAG: hypothetical protein EKK41_14965 [Hyphomicrobiales bacterium]|nr:MAG: hypothetical protein EKK41_14965 [Hyphomicrobiales bacterium]